MACDKSKMKTEAGQSVGAMQPVVVPDEVLSKQNTPDRIDAAFDALQLGRETPPEEPEKEAIEEAGCKEKMESAPDPIADAMRGIGIGLDSYMEYAEKDQERIYVEETFEESGAKIDDDIRPIINKLNQKGYKTRYSCSGHPSARMKNDNLRDGVRYGKLYSTARIVFDKIYDLPNIPDEWSKKVLNKGEEDEAIAIYVKPPKFHIIDGLPEKQYANWKKRYMAKLEKWANELPEAGKVKDDENSEVSLESVLEDIVGEVMLG